MGMELAGGSRQLRDQNLELRIADFEFKNWPLEVLVFERSRRSRMIERLERFERFKRFEHRTTDCVRECVWGGEIG